MPYVMRCHSLLRLLTRIKLHPLKDYVLIVVRLVILLDHARIRTTGGLLEERRMI